MQWPISICIRLLPELFEKSSMFIFLHGQGQINDLDHINLKTLVIFKPDLIRTIIVEVATCPYKKYLKFNFKRTVKSFKFPPYEKKRRFCFIIY